MQWSKGICPCCGYKVSDGNAVRCPRCNHLLQVLDCCQGSCRKCTTGCIVAGQEKRRQGKRLV
ncbi:hypothetical protein [Desulfofundulus sp.]|uniref:hypothetical protein n=1 Tax=Desulfofundulus sp. TaxID=2282750 RepID=UPI003C78D41E